MLRARSAGCHWRPASAFFEAGLQVVLPMRRSSGARTEPAVGEASCKLVAGDAMECGRRSIVGEARGSTGGTPVAPGVKILNPEPRTPSISSEALRKLAQRLTLARQRSRQTDSCLERIERRLFLSLGRFFDIVVQPVTGVSYGSFCLRGGSECRFRQGMS